jgi:hypothetical protein
MKILERFADPHVIQRAGELLEAKERLIRQAAELLRKAYFHDAVDVDACDQWLRDAGVEK